MNENSFQSQQRPSFHSQHNASNRSNRRTPLNLYSFFKTLIITKLKTNIMRPTQPKIHIITTLMTMIRLNTKLRIIMQLIFLKGLSILTLNRVFYQLRVSEILRIRRTLCQIFNQKSEQ